MNYKEIQVRLTMEMEGRLGEIPSNAATKEEINFVMSGKQLITPFNPPVVTKIKQVITLTPESGAVSYAISDDCKLRCVDQKNWSNTSKKNRLLLYAQDLAISLGCVLTRMDIIE